MPGEADTAYDDLTEPERLELGDQPSPLVLALTQYFPERCSGCLEVAMQTNKLAQAVDAGEIDKTAAHEIAQAAARRKNRQCVLGSTTTGQCMSGITLSNGA